MFLVELNDDGVDLFDKLFHITPVLVSDPWQNYSGTCVWRCNQYRTYSVPGEPEDAKWSGLFADGIFGNTSRGSLIGKLWERARTFIPTSAEEQERKSKQSAAFDQETMRGYAEALVGHSIKWDKTA